MILFETSCPSHGHLMERRREARAPVVLRVDYDSASALLADYATDLGTGGLFVRTDLPLEIGASIRLTLSFPGLLEPTEVDATVRWLRRGSAVGRGDSAGYGISFDPGQDARLVSIRQLLERIRKAVALPAKRSGTLEVLLVEDNKFVQDLFQHALRRLHEGKAIDTLRVHVAYTGHEALRLIPTIAPNLAIIDHYLPGITGAHLVRQLRSQPRFFSLPILVVSTGGRDARTEALESGATVYLDKPVLLTHLVSTIRAMLAEPAA